MTMSKTKQAPPVSKRPRCRYCGKPLSPRMCGDSVRIDDGRGGFAYKEVNRRWSGHYRGYYDTFCTLRCGTAFAVAAYKAGYRIKHDRRAAPAAEEPLP